MATSSGSSATLTSAPLAAGTYFLWVDSVSGVGTPGSFTLSASLTTAAGNGETCAGPIPLSFFGGTATASGSTSGMTNDNSSACTGSSGPDRVYSFTATAGQTLTASLTPSGWRGHLVLQGPNSSCSNMPEVACQLGSASGSVVSLTASNLAAGTYFLWVDGVSGSAGSFSLTAALSSGPPATGDTCSDPLPLNFSGFGLATASGSTATAFNDTTASCGGSGPDRVYVFSVVGTRTLSAGVTGSTGFRPVVYVRSSCASTADLSCMAASATGGTASISTTLGTGTYYLWVDGFSSTSGSYTLSATLN
ncbi:MAG: hypothetical protein INH37_15645 [Myxococcaceae bacterium]|nr:hypothetical protein [Myxococcaceae bacterium]